MITRAELAVIASKFDKLELNQSHNITDIDGHWAQPYIASAVKKGWVKGYEDGTFKPDQYITRAEFVTLVNSVLERKTKLDYILPGTREFHDLKNIKAWYYVDMKVATNSYLYKTLDTGCKKWLELVAIKVEM